MNILRINSSAQLVTAASPTRTGVTGTLNLGAQPSTAAFDRNTYASYIRNIRIYDVGEYAELDTTNSMFTNSSAYVAAVAQSEKVVAVGTVTADGTILLSVTSSVYSTLPSNTKVVTITTSGLPSAATWAGQARSALSNSSDISKYFVVSGTGTDIILTRIIDDYGIANDATFNIAIAAGTATGITNASTSTSLATGSLAEGVYIDQTDPYDAEGLDIGPTGDYSSAFLAKCIRGSGGAIDNASDFKFPLAEGVFCLHSNNDQTVDCGAAFALRFTSSTVPFEVTLHMVVKRA